MTLLTRIALTETYDANAHETAKKKAHAASAEADKRPKGMDALGDAHAKAQNAEWKAGREHADAEHAGRRPAGGRLKAATRDRKKAASDYNTRSDSHNEKIRAADDAEGHARRHDFHKRTGKKWEDKKHPPSAGDDPHSADLEKSAKHLGKKHPHHKAVTKAHKGEQKAKAKSDCGKKGGHMVFGRCIGGKGKALDNAIEVFRSIEG